MLNVLNRDNWTDIGLWKRRVHHEGALVIVWWKQIHCQAPLLAAGPYQTKLIGDSPSKLLTNYACVILIGDTFCHAISGGLCIRSPSDKSFQHLRSRPFPMLNVWYNFRSWKYISFPRRVKASNDPPVAFKYTLCSLATEGAAVEMARSRSARLASTIER